MAKNKYGLVARLVWDGGDEVRIPEELGTPAPNQMKGTPGERVAELSGRTCYDSLGRGRSSEDYHKHILEVGHTSVLAHFHQTVELNCPVDALQLLNRPGLWTSWKGPALRVAFNARSIVDWNMWSLVMGSPDTVGGRGIGDILAYHAEKALPMVFAPRVRAPEQVAYYEAWTSVVIPAHDEEKWVSLMLSGSRGLSHEQVRHGFRTGISQRCIAGDAKIRFVCGSQLKSSREKQIQWLYERFQNPRLRPLMRRLKPRVLNEQTGLFSAGRLEEVIRSGEKPCFHLELEGGRSLKCTEDHRIWTQQGWKTLKEIAEPKVTEGGVVTWDKETSTLVGINGIAVVGNGLYRDLEWMKARVHDGLSDREISQLCGATQSTVKTYRNRLGLKKRLMGDFTGSPVQDKAWLYKQYRIAGRSHAEIADLAKCSIAAVHNWCRAHGIQKTRREINLGREPWNKAKSYTQTKRYSPESIERYRLSKLGDRNPHWKGGRGSVERRAFGAWKRKHGQEIFERDGWRCRLCGRAASEVQANSLHMRKRRIEIHHILPLWNRPDLACDPNNMATVCWECQSKRLNRKELSFAEQLLKAIASPLPYAPSKRRLSPPPGRPVRVHFKKIKAIRYAGMIETYDLVLDGPNHGFVANGIVVHNSTRYVDEDGSPWLDHPLVQEFMTSAGVDADALVQMDEQIKRTKTEARKAYSLVASTLQDWLKERGVDKLTSRKQARGAARGYLGNALQTEMIFSASVGQWKRMLRQRCNDGADAEIRILYTEVLPELLKSRYAESFREFRLLEASDKIGQVAEEKR